MRVALIGSPVAGVVGVILIAATLATFALGSHHHGTGSWIVLVLWAVALFKARLIGMYFMDLRTAPLALRVCFDAYCLVLWAVLCGMYVWS